MLISKLNNVYYTEKHCHSRKSVERESSFFDFQISVLKGMAIPFNNRSV